MEKKRRNFCRFATFNVSLARQEMGALLRELETPQHEQLQKLAAIIQWIRPDVLLLQEIDYDEKGRALSLFNQHYLNHSQYQQSPIDYPYQCVFPSNTGIAVDYPPEEKLAGELYYPTFGFGHFAGQYAFALLSKYPLLTRQQRRFQYFLWRDMPEPLLPTINDSDKAAFFTQKLWPRFRLSSKNHVDIPVVLPCRTVHLLLSHPTPPLSHVLSPAFNACRNHDEIRLWHDYLLPERSGYLYDDQGTYGGLLAGESAVIMGDLNADPNAGDGIRRGIRALLQHPRLHAEVATGRWIPRSRGGQTHAAQRSSLPFSRLYFARAHTASWGLRADYVLPSDDLSVRASGVFWPTLDQAEFAWVAHDVSSDHRLVWVDVLDCV
ncbi:endonuclease/exonuclease/phosphatase family protein [Thioflexithrix psekupsensis]|uniref:Endonuclease/exonuclease/phosphatase domain-containing protein n=1 Tax=Thioflexithrix psekupsensis TaxID=1570016 RepID=A0A251XCY2_9GAMM|nr:endonuclease/exonuclease/phosphatase family protein [Thioflexithrix psekupsensis]OUD16292.1 hypothetical protein TPSD3_00795 [Thioflexithrix psekupsensis]